MGALAGGDTDENVLENLLFVMTKCFHQFDNNNSHSYCVVVSNTVTGICRMGARKFIGRCTSKAGENVVPVPATYTSISGTLSTTNLIMANWPDIMWQSVVDRAIRVLASSPFGLHFSSATATIGGN
ncbi:hypothetical protein KIN20_036392 [Parelaphostrongylus tenuis]|uniref:Uncharacterized protein n=1 Tax=Parelaphostrongylus tenuis TaxID=148309 RepID=A0AAD5RD40_PARTN|nr:hypothetical protein KIN20_036392 [Parelaphostrongylus tenuis]